MPYGTLGQERVNKEELWRKQRTNSVWPGAVEAEGSNAVTRAREEYGATGGLALHCLKNAWIIGGITCV